MPKKDVYASIGTILTLGAILLLLLWFKLMIPSPPIAEQGIEVGYGVDPDGEVGGSSGGQRGDLAGTPDGDFYAKQIEAPSFSERPAEAPKPQVSAAAASSSESSSDNTLTQDGDEVVSASSGGSGKGTADQADLERQRAAQEEARRRTAAEQQAHPQSPDTRTMVSTRPARRASRPAQPALGRSSRLRQWRPGR